MQEWRAHIIRYGRTWFPGEPWVRTTFMVLFAFATILRFWDLPNIPYTHDEISALVRIYPSLYETVHKGFHIHVDAHPPGVQIFEWLWTRLFGMSEGVVKLPFILMGLAAIFLLYRTAIRWTSAPVALLLTVLMATLQYPVMYAQIARPYAAGLFTTALLADRLTSYIGRGGTRHLRGVLVGAVLSAYVHHFSLLLAALMVLGGFMFIRPGQRKGYLFMCALGVLLYLPNLPLFLRQLSLGGLTGWLSPPDIYWLRDHAMYISHWSLPFALLLGGIVVLSVALWIRNDIRQGPAFPLFLFWGLTPLVVGIAYSVWRAPVIQYSVVLFSFPYLVIVLLMGLRQLPRNATLGLVAITTIASVTTLIFTRRHYEIFYQSKYEEIVRRGMQAMNEHGGEGVEVFIDAPDEVIRFYMQRWGLTTTNLPYTQLRNTLSAGHLDRRLRSLGGRRIILGQTNGAAPEHLPRIQLHFPHLLSRTDMPDGEIYEFSDRDEHRSLHVEDRRLIAMATPLSLEGPWELAPDLPVTEAREGVMAWDFNGREYGLALALRTDTLINDAHDLFETVAHLHVQAPAREASVPGQLFLGGTSLFYRDGRLDELLLMDGPGHLMVAVRPVSGHARREDLLYKTYIYNHGLGPVAVERMEVWLRRANPRQYALVGPLRE